MDFFESAALHFVCAERVYIFGRVILVGQIIFVGLVSQFKWFIPGDLSCLLRVLAAISLTELSGLKRSRRKDILYKTQV